jgi:hypothetical protein
MPPGLMAVSDRASLVTLVPGVQAAGDRTALEAQGWHPP